MTRNQRGAAGSVLVAAVCLSLVTVFAAGAVLIQWFYVMRRAEQVAELSALAAVIASVDGRSPCPAAAEAAGLNGASVSRCRTLGGGDAIVVTVTVRAELLPRLGWGPRFVDKSASAGSGSGRPQ